MNYDYHYMYTFSSLSTLMYIKSSTNTVHMGRYHTALWKYITYRALFKICPLPVQCLSYSLWNLSQELSMLRFQQQKWALLAFPPPSLYSALPPTSGCLSQRLLFIPPLRLIGAQACHERVHTKQEKIKGQRDIRSASDQTICATRNQFFFTLHLHAVV